MFSWNRLFLSLFESCLLTCLLALFCFSTCAFFNFLSFACQVCFSVVWLFYFAIRHFFIFSVISVLSFANLHINNVICKLICCFLTANPDRCFVVICLLFSLSLVSFCVSSSFSVFLFQPFALSPFSFVLFPHSLYNFSSLSRISTPVFFFFLYFLSIFSPLPIKHLVLLAFLVHLPLSLPSSGLLCAPTRPPASHV